MNSIRKIDMLVKICGLTTLADARYAASLGASHLGFVMHNESPRSVTPETAREIISWLFGAACVGVFVDETVDAVNHAAEVAGFDVVQLHGTESVEYCRSIERPIIKAFRPAVGTSAAALIEQIEAYGDTIEYVLLDAHDPDLAGGTGREADWKLASDIASDFPLFLAGGLGPDNVSVAIETVHPAGIDASSVLEESPGIKSFEILDTFFNNLAPYLSLYE